VLSRGIITASDLFIHLFFILIVVYFPLHLLCILYRGILITLIGLMSGTYRA
jgi:hypothetical protein